MKKSIEKKIDEALDGIIRIQQAYDAAKEVYSNKLLLKVAKEARDDLIKACHNKIRSLYE